MPLFTRAVALLLFASIGASASALEVDGYSVQADGARVLGASTYELLVGDASYEVRSVLEFPLDGWYAGARAKLHLLASGGRSYVVDLRWLSALSDPRELMKDHDWNGVPDGPSVKFSYTESHARSSAHLFDLTVSRPIRPTRVGWIYLGTGLRHHRVHQDIDGYDGWYLDSSGNVVSQAGDEPAITYTVSYTSAGVLGALVADRLSFLRAALTIDLGTVYVSDRDDHLLRNKLSTANGFGFTLGTALELNLYPAVTAGRVKPWIGLAAEVRRSIADISQTQEWYDDEPGGPSAGTRYTGIPHKVDLFQLALRLSVGMEVPP